MSLDRVEKLMEDTQDAIEYQQEIDNLLSQNMTEQDDESVMAELEELSRMDLDALPTVPQHVPQHQTNQLAPQEAPQQAQQTQPRQQRTAEALAT